MDREVEYFCGGEMGDLFLLDLITSQKKITKPPFCLSIPGETSIFSLLFHPIMKLNQFTINII